jgi:hypothetical protein
MSRVSLLGFDRYFLAIDLMVLTHRGSGDTHEETR